MLRFSIFSFTYTYRAINNPSDIENVVIIVIITLVVAFTSAPHCFPFAVYTFEDAIQLMAFIAAPSTIELSTSHYKHGTKSMKWTWASENEITHSISVR